MGFRQWIYHETEAPKIIDSDNFDLFYDEGWRDSPAPFIKVADFDLDADDAVGVQQLGDTVQGIVDSTNGALNIDKMKKAELFEYASDHFGVELDESMHLAQLRAEIKVLINGNGE
jgi:hypothetical protein